MWGNQFLDTYSHYNFNFSFPVKMTNNPIRIIIWQYWWWLFFSSIFIIYYFILTKFLLKRPLKFRPKIVTSYRSHGRWGDIIVSLIPIYWCLNILTHSNTLLKLNEMQTETSLVTVRVRGRQWYWVYKIDIYNFFNINNFRVKMGLKSKVDLLNNSFVQTYSMYENFWKNIFSNKLNLFKTGNTDFIENVTDGYSKKKNFYKLIDKSQLFNKKWYTNFNKLNVFFTKNSNTKKNVLLNKITDCESISVFKKYNTYGFSSVELKKVTLNIFIEYISTKNFKKFNNLFFNKVKKINTIFTKNKYSFNLKTKNGYILNKIKLFKPYKNNTLLKNKFNIIDVNFNKDISNKISKTFQKYSIVIDQNRKIFDMSNNKLDSFNFNDNLFINKEDYSILVKNSGNKVLSSIWSDFNVSYKNKYQLLSNYKEVNFAKTNNNLGSFLKKNKNFLQNQRLLHTNSILVLPINMNITIITNSYDVIHSWFIPGLGLKMDCVPGRSTHHTLFIDSCGIYYGQCAEICGRFHHHMPIKIAALTWEHFLLWWYHNIKNIGLHQFNKDLNKKNLSRMNNKDMFSKTNFLKNKRPFI